MKKIAIILTLIFITGFDALSSNPKFFIFDSTNSPMKVNGVRNLVYNKNDNKLWYISYGYIDSSYICDLFSFDENQFNNLTANENFYNMYGFTIDSSNKPWLTSIKRDTNFSIISKYNGVTWESFQDDSWNLFYDLKTDCYGNVLVCAYHSIMVFDKDFNVIQRFSIPTISNQYYHQATPSSLLIDNCSSIWFSNGESGLYQYELDSSKVKEQILWLNKNNSMVNYLDITNIYKVSKSDIWFSAIDFDFLTRRLIRYDGNKFIFLDSLLGSRVIGEERSGNLVITTLDSGLFRVDISGTQWEYFDKDLPKCYIGSMVYDNDGNIWFASDIGLIKYNENGIDEVENPVNENIVLSISPNPSPDFIEISYSPLEKGVRGLSDELPVRIYNVFGEEVNLTPALSMLGEGGSTPFNSPASGGHLRIDVSFLSPGLYFVRVGGRVGKFVKF